jgi:ubiquinone biosynthesis accessory factor UbiK
MIDTHTLDQILADMRKALPGGFAQDMEKNMRAALTATLARLNLVTREELEVQNAVLTRTREKIAALEKQVAELEKLLRK